MKLNVTKLSEILDKEQINALVIDSVFKILNEPDGTNNLLSNTLNMNFLIDMGILIKDEVDGDVKKSEEIKTNENGEVIPEEFFKTYELEFNKIAQEFKERLNQLNLETIIFNKK